MLVWEAHRDLSNAIGDEVAATNGNIPDGVRFDRAQRDDYLNRAMLKIYKDILSAASQLPMRKQRNEIIGRMLPNQINQYDGILDPKTPEQGNNLYHAADLNNFPRALYIMEFFASTGAGYIPLPVRMGMSGNYLNEFNVLKSDPWVSMIHTQGNFGAPISFPIIWDPQGIINGQTFTMNYLGYPTDPGGQLSSEELSIERSMTGEMLRFATLYAFTDSQDIENIDRYLLPQTQQGGGM